MLTPKNVYALAKMRKAKHVDALLDGKLRMGSIEYYRDCFDEFEGVAGVLPATLTISDGSEELTLSRDDWPEPGEFRLRDVYVFCLFSFHGPRVPTDEPLDTAHARELARLKDQARMLAQCADTYGERVVLITNGPEFKRRVRAAANERGYRCYSQLVRYYEPDSQPTLGPNLLDVAFAKRIEFQHENEYRIVVCPGRLNQTFLELDIGDIRDITLSYPTRDFEESISIGLDIGPSDVDRPALSEEKKMTEGPRFHPNKVTALLARQDRARFTERLASSDDPNLILRELSSVCRAIAQSARQNDAQTTAKLARAQARIQDGILMVLHDLMEGREMSESCRDELVDIVLSCRRL